MKLESHNWKKGYSYGLTRVKSRITSRLREMRTGNAALVSGPEEQVRAMEARPPRSL